jgi:hypothetical protein
MATKYGDRISKSLLSELFSANLYETKANSGSFNSIDVMGDIRIELSTR